MKYVSLALLALSLSLAANAQTVRLSKGAGGVVREEVVNRDSGQKMARFTFQLRKLSLNKTKSRYNKIAIDKLPLTSEVGMPSLPFQAVTIDAAASDIRVSAQLGEPVAINAGKIFPAQVEPCRCAEPPGTIHPFADKLDTFTALSSGFKIESLGDFRGQPVSRVLVYPHKYDAKSGVLLVYPNAKFEISYSAPSKNEADPLYDYLVLTPRVMMGSLASWVDWKRSSQGLRFNVVAYEDIGSPGTDALKTWFHNEYNSSHFKFALIVGTKQKIPQQTVETTTDKNTPSDLPYFTMGDANDVIPEAYAGRVVTDNPDTLAHILKKWVEYERDANSSGAGWHRAIGIASNEGSSPSDADYINAIHDKFKANYGSESVYLFQNNADSNPTNFNNQLTTGAMWVTYIGHGSGTNWPSFGTSYGIPNIQALRNAGSVKPVWIDVACLNGALETGAAGANLASAADPSGAPTGVTAYYGGTVLVSWHPPAVFARGVAFKLSDMVHPLLGEALQAGQRYLSENNSNVQDIASNQRWYHLQGDPSLRLRVK